MIWAHGDLQGIKISLAPFTMHLLSTQEFLQRLWMQKVQRGIEFIFGRFFLPPFQPMPGYYGDRFWNFSTVAILQSFSIFCFSWTMWTQLQCKIAMVWMFVSSRHPSSYVGILTHKVMVLEGGAFEWWLGSEGGVFMGGINALINETPPRSFVLSAMWRYNEKSTTWKRALI